MKTPGNSRFWNGVGSVSETVPMEQQAREGAPSFSDVTIQKGGQGFPPRARAEKGMDESSHGVNEKSLVPEELAALPQRVG